MRLVRREEVAATVADFAGAMLGIAPSLFRRMKPLLVLYAEKRTEPDRQGEICVVPGASGLSAVAAQDSHRELPTAILVSS